MHVQIVLNNGEILGLDMSWAAVLSGPGKFGEIVLDFGPGIQRHIPKGFIANVWQFTDDAWKKAREEHDAQDRAQKEAQEKAQRRAHAERVIAEWHKQPWWKKVGRHCPITLPPESGPVTVQLSGEPAAAVAGGVKP
jgi:hypothetical protein